VVIPEAGRQLCRDAIEKYIGSDALQRFEHKRALVRQQFQQLREKAGMEEALRAAMDSLSKEIGQNFDS